MAAMPAYADTLPLHTIFLAFLLAGAVKGVIGMGLPTVAIGLLGLAMPVSQAAALLVLPSLVTNIWQALAGGHLAAIWRRFWALQIGIAAGTLGGGALIAPASAPWAPPALGAALLAYGAMGLAAYTPRLPQAGQRTLGAGVGLATGLVTAATGVFVIPAVPYLQAACPDRNELVQALGLSFLTATLALGASLAGSGLMRAELAQASLLALLPALAGVWLGQWLRRRISPQAFRRVFFLGMLALGGHLLLRG